MMCKISSFQTDAFSESPIVADAQFTVRCCDTLPMAKKN